MQSPSAPAMKIKSATPAMISNILRRTREADLQHEITELFKQLGYKDVVPKYNVEIVGYNSKTRKNIMRKECDLFIYSGRIVGEIKGRKSAHPNNPGSRSGITQYEQLRDYMENIAAGTGIFDRGPYRGFLTDGETWYLYDWDMEARDLVNRGVVQLLEMFGSAAHKFNEEILGRLAPSGEAGATRPPQDLAETELAPHLGGLKIILRKTERKKEFTTKRKLWHSLLDTSGIVPSEKQFGKVEDVFLQHTMLVCISRIIIALVRRKSAKSALGKREIKRIINDGFVAWLYDSDGGAGEDWVVELSRKLESYEWRGMPRDVIRDYYHKLIANEFRKEFGEFYTPNDLADLIVSRSLDEEWLRENVGRARKYIENKNNGNPSVNALKGCGVLDPACGSGTFLFHSAKRIVRYANETLGLSAEAVAEIAACLVVGIDIHPIAVEMSKATLMTALPPSRVFDEKSLNVFIGDSMQIEKSASVGLPGDKTVNLDPTRKGGNFLLPETILWRADFVKIIDGFVNQAINKKAKWRAPGGLSMSVRERAVMDKCYEALVDKIHDEGRGNHVWSWFIRNKIAPLVVSLRQVSRIVGNPPWLVPNNSREAQKKKDIQRVQSEYCLRPKGDAGRSSAKGDLASVFSARTTDLYLGVGGTVHWVLPTSALISQVWGPWRSGVWGCEARMKMLYGWDLAGIIPLVFPHSPNGACVVGGRRMPKAESALTAYQRWTGNLGNARKTKIKVPNGNPSHYLPYFKSGTLGCKPTGLFIALKKYCLFDSRRGTVEFTTKKSNKGEWKNLELAGIIESASMIPTVRSQRLAPFSAAQDAYSIVPCDEKRRILSASDWPANTLPLTKKYWRRAGRVFTSRSAGQSHGRTLFQQLDYKRTMTAQLACFLKPASGKRRKKVVYNASGSKRLMAARIAEDLLANQALYWTVCGTWEEAAYLCSVINADNLQQAWLGGKSSVLSFDKSPWRTVPVPKYDEKNKWHKQLVAACLQAEKGDIENAMKKICRATAKILPGFVE